MIVKILVLCISLTIPVYLLAQSDSSINEIPRSFADRLFNKFKSVEQKIKKKNNQVLRTFVKQEKKLERTLKAKDSAAAANLFKHSKTKLKKLQQLPNDSAFKGNKWNQFHDEYTDNLSTSLDFILQTSDSVGPTALRTGVLQSKTQLNELRQRLKQSLEIEKYLKERKNFLKAEFEKFGLGKKIKAIDKTSYYYKEYMNEYKTMLKDRSKAEKKAMELLYRSAGFKKFAKNNSWLSKILRQPPPDQARIPDPGLPVLPGIQTRASINAAIQQRVDPVGTGTGLNIVKQKIQEGQTQFAELKSKIAKYGTEDGDKPLFKPNTQKTKPLLKRLEYGMNIQFTKSNHYFPSTTALAFTVGYKINDKSSAGVGVSGMIGMGKGWDKISFSMEGIGLRSYLDWKVKKSLYISGGYEKNYIAAIKSISQLKEAGSWTTSALIGLSKTYKATKKAKGKVQVLYDAMAGTQVPVRSPFIFRTGLTFK